jgi:hypothetical protein
MGDDPPVVLLRRSSLLRTLWRIRHRVLARIEAVLAETEDRTDFVRTAVERELARREKRKPGKAQSEG